jgi:hypothetical protein
MHNPSDRPASRKDSDNIAILEKLRPEHGAALNRLIRSEADLERGERDIAEHRAALKEGWQTDDLDAVRGIILANYAANTRDVDEFAALLDEVRRELAVIDAGI